MKFGVREICDVVLRAKSAMKVGDKIFYKNEPVLYFDSLKTSSMEGQATTVYAQGGRGNARLIAWEGERTVTFTMEDALISPAGFSILTGAGLTKASENNLIIVHKSEVTNKVEVFENNNGGYVRIALSEIPYIKAGVIDIKYVPMYVKVKDSDIYNENIIYYKQSGNLESYIPSANKTYYITDNNQIYVFEENETAYRGAISKDNSINDTNFDNEKDKLYMQIKEENLYQRANDNEDFMYIMLLDENGEVCSEPYIASEIKLDSQYIYIYAQETDDNYGTNPPQESDVSITRINDISGFTDGCSVLVDYYVKKNTGAFEIDITPDKFGGNFYLEASTLFRATNGVDMPAEFIIPNCKIQSNFTFTMASSGDPSTFTFTMDAFPDYTRWDKTKKVFATIQVIEDNDTLTGFERGGTDHTQNADVWNSQKDELG